MKTFRINKAFLYLLAIMLAVGIGPAMAQPNFSRHMPPGMMPPSGNDATPSGDNSSGGKNSSGGPWIPSEPLTEPRGSTNAADQIELSFQGASVDMVAQWLAQTTGKTVIKDPQVNCQVTIMSSKKMPKREAINMIYRALGIQGYSVVELSDSILIVPQGKEPRMSPEVVNGSLKNVPAGRQMLVKVFQLKHAQAADVKDRIQTALSDKASVEVDESANQIIVTDYNDNLRVVGDLIDALDSEHPQDVAVRVIPLKHIAADDLAKEVAPLYEKMNEKGPSKTAVDVAADDRSNSLIVFSDLTQFGTIEKLVEMLDTEDAQAKVTHTYVLKNADAEDVAKQLQDLNQSQESTTRFAYYFGSPPNNPKTLSVVADRRRNAVIVQCPPAQAEGVSNMIAELDAPVSDNSLAPEIFPLKYVNASDIEDVLNELFLKKSPQRNYWDFYFGDDNSDNTTENNDVGRLYGKVRITSDPYSNAIIVTANSREDLDVIANVLKELDQPSESGEGTLRVGLKYAKADTVANGFNILFAKNGSPALHQTTQPQSQNSSTTPGSQQSQQPTDQAQSGFDIEQDLKEEGYYPWLGGQPDLTQGTGNNQSSPWDVSDLVGRVRCVADDRGNAVLVSANVHFFPQILKLLQAVDAPSDKVSIDARIVQVSSDYLHQLGVRWSPNGAAEFSGEDNDDSFVVSGSGNYQQGFGGKTLVNSPPNSTATVLQTLASLRSGVASSTLNIDFLVQFLRENTDATVLGEPSITIDDNEMGKLFVGQEVPVPQNNQISSVGSTSTQITYQDVGVTLEVTPHINIEGDVQLKIHAESSTVDASSGQVLGGDVFDTDNFRTEVTAKNSQTIVLGGIIQKQTSNIVRKVPILGSIPLIGWVFKNNNKTAQDVELMVFLRPTIIHTAEDADALEKELERKTPLLQQWREAPSQAPLLK